jgi:signal transduction histidine kinase
MQVLRTKNELGNERVREIVEDLVGDLDTTISSIRTTIFGLQQRTRESLRGDVYDLVAEYAEVLGFMPALRTHGSIDLMIPAEVGENVLAVLREALSNVARHARAGAASVDVWVSDSTVALEVSDTGVGIPEQRFESGLKNARDRAASLGGTLEVTPNAGPGTLLRWSCPLEPVLTP